MDKRDLFSIGCVAKMFHISVGTLRHYERSGLLSPEYIDPHTGYRYYSTKQFEVLSTIRSLRVLDMPLEQIFDFLQNREIDNMNFIEKHKMHVSGFSREITMIDDGLTNDEEQFVTEIQIPVQMF